MEIEKQLAFMQYIDEPYFKISYEDEDIFYVGRFIEIAREYIEEMQLNGFEISSEDFKSYLYIEGETVEDYLSFNHKDLEDDYLILTDEEANEKWEESLDNYIDECILPEIPEAYRRYFDHKAFKFDAKFDGRGHSLSSYDGIENEEYVKEFDQTFYIYRIN